MSTLDTQQASARLRMPADALRRLALANKIPTVVKSENGHRKAFRYDSSVIAHYKAVQRGRTWHVELRDLDELLPASPAAKPPDTAADPVPATGGLIQRLASMKSQNDRLDRIEAKVDRVLALLEGL